MPNSHTIDLSHLAPGLEKVPVPVGSDNFDMTETTNPDDDWPPQRFWVRFPEDAKVVWYGLKNMPRLAWLHTSALARCYFLDEAERLRGVALQYVSANNRAHYLDATHMKIVDSAGEMIDAAQLWRKVQRACEEKMKGKS